MKKNIVILISGRGSNMQAIIKANIPNANIRAVISNQASSEGLLWAKAQGIYTTSLDHKHYPNRSKFDQTLIELINIHQPDLIILAGFMRILTEEFCQYYEGKIMNIHPSLLPAFTGLHTHKRALNEGCKFAGCTVHFVTPELDHGPIIVQAVTPILSHDTEETLSARVLKLEHMIYPKAVSDFINGSLTIKGKKVIHSKNNEPNDSLDFLINS